MSEPEEEDLILEAEEAIKAAAHAAALYAAVEAANALPNSVANRAAELMAARQSRPDVLVREGPVLGPHGNHRNRKRKPEAPPSAQWPEGRACCKKKCNRKYTESSIHKIRRKSARHYFDADAGTIQTNCSANRKAWARARLTRPSAHGKRDSTYRLDTPDLLQDDHYDAPIDARDLQTQPVCAKFYRWATCQSSQFVSDFHNDRQPGARLGSASAKKAPAIRQWLDMLGSMYQHSPDSQLILLPFVDKR